MIEANLPILLIVIPMVTAPLCVLAGRGRTAYLLALLASIAVFITAVAMVAKVNATGVIHYEIGGWAPPYGIEYVVDRLSSFVMLFVSALGAIVLLYAPASVNQEILPSKHYLFYATYLLCLTGLLGMCVTGDLFNVFVFLEISSLSSYALISLGRTRRAPLAALQYLIVGSIGATFILIGIGLLYQMTGTLNMADIAARVNTDHGPRTVSVAFAFLTVGLCVKMAVFPLHTWLPGAYTYAPSVVTAFIAATATKVSVYAFVRLVFGIITPEFAFGVLPLDTALMVFSLIGIFVASTAAIFQDDVKRLLAYSSVAQIGYMLLGISMANADGLSAGIVHMFNHALIKGGLFMVVGCFVLRLGSSRLSDWAGAAKTMPWTSLAWAIGGLGLIGVPLTAGFISKWLLLTSAMQNNYWPVAVLMLMSSLLAVVYVWRVVETLYFGEPSTNVAQAAESPRSMLIPTYVVITAVVVFGVWTQYSAGLASSAALDLLGGTP
ncbi:monovalent cation/H+ antiporter subunit D family protein [Rubripirellula amarantea]|uniref:Na(+)/H(+) antiporter subunit D1 n=1 Tax=Rubripirellula amarantea TaxID=2527999 RepID=A0A5C5WB91_9BACT|nr:monovalent cation/H+ antiporter subunit D family protein [Rubripirellula amarantea]MDA8743448.1 monovalent cation/H+ antiporter subunit D family protein [Rubripirellula amarantea]TWT48128.1 Na(+)/H(+) antiporter subunit D1 [Rubripirellula amarantea]